MSVGTVPLSVRGRRGQLASACHTTRDLLALEQQTLRIAVGTAGAGRPGTAARRDDIDTVLAGRPALSVEQRRAVLSLASSDRSLDVLVAPAGAGKTTVLGACHDAWTASGIPVAGTAVAGRAAAELTDTARIPATTIAAILRRPREGSTPERGVLVVDEAGMVGTRALHELVVRAAANHTRLVLVGDPHQLPEIDAGGIFADLARELPAHTLTANLRQREAWERAALAELRHGKIDKALAAYARHDRVVVHDDHPTTLARCVNEWLRDRSDGTETVMVASLRSDVAQLNRLARHALERAGQLSGRPLVVGDRDYRIGDEIVCLRNNQRLGVTNGTRGVVFDIDHTTRQITIAISTGERRTLPARYLDAGHVDHGYALTVHKAQGLTTERVHAVIGTDSYRELAYTALSRGRTTNQLYVTPDTDDDQRHGVADPLVELNAALALSRQQQSATQHRRRRHDGPELSL